MSDPALEALLTASHRSERHVARNEARHPVETLTFFGLQPTMTVLEVLPAFGWYTEILAPYLADQGRLYVAHFSPDGVGDYMPAVLGKFEDRMHQESEIFGRVTVRHINPPSETTIAPPGTVDLV